ncbi:hypothetical protein BBJ28_00018249 [Nothophytophthora sp. Chile5]|nr:hypothetical protein BBJ28_00018249 [Nothophytophthora sp. Chile5]
MSWKFKPDAGRFHYGLSLQYSPSDTALTLSSIKALSVTLSSTAMSTLRYLPPTTGEALGSKAWRLVAETEDPRVGIALYELPLGDWRASSLVALVWTQTREVSRLFLQLHTAELLHSAPQRALKVRRDDDLDRSHGLHSYTAAVSLRSLDQLFWEHEVYDVEFPTPEASSVTVQLLDDVHGGSTAARDRTLCSETDPALRVETEAITYAMRNCLLVDFTLWDADCMPVWAFSRALEITATSGRQQENEYDDVDMSVSSAGEVIRRLELRFHDEARSNELVVRLMSLSPPLHQQTTKKTKLWVAQVSVTLSLSFINTTFGTKY